MKWVALSRLGLAFAISAVAAKAVPSAPENLRLDDATNPVGTRATPYFGWDLPGDSAEALQSHYEIRLTEDPKQPGGPLGAVWSSGEVASRNQNHIAYDGPPLNADTRYRWQVRIRNIRGELSPFSAPAEFTVGLLSNAAWGDAVWIRREPQVADDYTYFRRQVDLPRKPIERATAYVAAMHHYELWVGGRSIGKGIAYHYPQYQYYHAWDVTTECARGGPTVFGLFNHWFGGGQGRPTGASGVIMKVVVHYRDGSTFTFGTGPDWKTSRAAAWAVDPVVHRRESEGVGYVERIDARLRSSHWLNVGFDDASWTAATVIGPQPTAPWTGTLAPDLSRLAEHEIAPVSVTPQAGGAYLVDFGKVYAGMPRVDLVGGTPGAEVVMHGGYALKADGSIDVAQNQGTNLDFVAILDGGRQRFAPTEFVGLRYLRIEHAPQPITAADCRFLTRHTELDSTRSEFTSSDSTLNAVWELTKHTLAVSAQEQFLDTPTREQGSFLGDSIWQSIAAMPAYRERLLTRRALGEFIQSMEQYWRKPADRGRMNAVYPNGDGARDIPDNTQTYLVWAWEYYLQTGDREFLRTHFDHLREIADLVERARLPATGLVTDLPGGDGAYRHGIIDWPPSMRFGYDVTTAARTVVNCLGWADFEIMRRISDELGRTAEAAVFRDRAKTLGEAINRRLINREGVYIDGLMADGTPSPHVSQQANILPLALGLVPPQHRDAVIERVKALKMSVGMETVGWLLRALGEADQGESLVELLTNPHQPGWARCLARGATTTWESWFADEEKDTSQSHGWGSIGLRGITDYILGVQPLQPQSEIVRIHPLDCGGRLSFARGRVATERGAVGVDWKRDGTRYHLRIEIPGNMTAEVWVPAGQRNDQSLLIDGAPSEGTRHGGYLLAAKVGPGVHVFERQLDGEPAPAAIR